MFGALLPSRPIQTLTPLTPATFTLTFPPHPPFTHLVVFLLPNTLLPPDTGAAVYIRFPGRDVRFLGAIGNEKASAIFRVRGGGGGGGGLGGWAGGGGGEDEMVDAEEGSGPGANGTGGGGGGGGEEEIAVGIAIEPLPQILASLQTLQSSMPTTTTTTTPPSFSSTALTKVPPLLPATSLAPVATKVLARRIIGNAFNFLASFAGTMTVVEGREVEVVPLGAFRDWWLKFERRVEADPGFLERGGDGDG